MIAIWDNGEDYSEHAVLFIDMQGWSGDRVRALLSIRDPYGRLVALVGAVEWYRAPPLPIASPVLLDRWAKRFNMDDPPALRPSQFEALAAYLAHPGCANEWPLRAVQKRIEAGTWPVQEADAG